MRKLTRQQYEMLCAIRGIGEGFMSDILAHLRKCKAHVPVTNAWSYSTLKTLRDRKLVASRAVEHAPRNMKAARLTKLGEKTLDKWLTTLEMLGS